MRNKMDLGDFAQAPAARRSDDVGSENECFLRQGWLKMHLLEA